MRNEELAKRVVDFLNEVYALDPDWLTELCNFRPFCNSAIAQHPTIQVGRSDEFSEDGRSFTGAKDVNSEIFRGGLIGLLNGLCGCKSSGSGFIQTVGEKASGEIQGFKLSKDKKATATATATEAVGDKPGKITLWFENALGKTQSMEIDSDSDLAKKVLQGGNLSIGFKVDMKDFDCELPALETQKD